MKKISAYIVPQPDWLARSGYLLYQPMQAHSVRSDRNVMLVDDQSSIHEGKSTQGRDCLVERFVRKSRFIGPLEGFGEQEQRNWVGRQHGDVVEKLPGRRI
ncbi:hypothetical protein DBIPINDM_001866 [Mesorhizobium sp. AR02]|uniref:hypothetical protein n=1 Tax=Mesorhizobium sp. AR02 TaxID=2865837 RepID=UPI00215FFA8C|nr:hypothetical protein [Mesorhizobium sp. AR02]UVK55359.1 hypothetical protein DBIPINDM_001866 [Mesorhizobium sp. AR02]